MDYCSDKEREAHHLQHHQQQQQPPASAGLGTHHFITSSELPPFSATSTLMRRHDDILSLSQPQTRDWLPRQPSASGSYKFREWENDDDAKMRSSEVHHRRQQSSHHTQTLPAALLEQIEKEHMFDKVVTPSDVGKLNRLVIPKQHAEKYFPLDSSANEKGLLLNFEDRTRKLWRFRYSYWNSSQSYVMTKGWSRFVKDKKLDAGDIVSFHRGVGEGFRDRLFIDWRRRSNNPLMFHHQRQPSLMIPSFSLLPHQYFPSHQSARSAPWEISTTTPLYLRPLAQLTSSHLHFPQHNYYNNSFHSHSHLHDQYQQLHQSVISNGSFQYCCNPNINNNGVVSHPYGSSVEGSSSQTALYLRSSADESLRGDDGGNNSFPAVHPKADQGKMLRLFGVNMECDTHEPNSLVDR